MERGKPKPFRAEKRAIEQSRGAAGVVVPQRIPQVEVAPHGQFGAPGLQPGQNPFRRLARPKTEQRLGLVETVLNVWFRVRAIAPRRAAALRGVEYNAVHVAAKACLDCSHRPSRGLFVMARPSGNRGYPDEGDESKDQRSTVSAHEARYSRPCHRRHSRSPAPGGSSTDY